MKVPANAQEFALPRDYGEALSLIWQPEGVGHYYPLEQIDASTLLELRKKDLDAGIDLRAIPFYFCKNWGAMQIYPKTDCAGHMRLLYQPAPREW